MKFIFKTKNNQLRALWKIIILCLFISIFLIISAISMENYGIDDEYGLMIFASFIIGTILSLLMVDRKKLKDLGLVSLKSKFTDIFIGLLLGGVLVVINVMILYLLGDLSFVTKLNNPNIGMFLLKGLGVFVVVSIAEEVMFRGYIMLSMKHMNKPWFSILVSAAIFSLSHGALNDGASTVAVINISLAGIMLAYMFYRSKSLYLPIGVHITWNYFQGFIFGVNVSGREVGEAAYLAKMENNILTGGTFGLEGGLVNTFVMILAMLIVYLLYRKSDKGS